MMGTAMKVAKASLEEKEAEEAGTHSSGTQYVLTVSPVSMASDPTTCRMSRLKLAEGNRRKYGGHVQLLCYFLQGT